MNQLNSFWTWLNNLMAGQPSASTSSHSSFASHTMVLESLRRDSGLILVEQDPKGNARSWRQDELAVLTTTLQLLGPEFGTAFVNNPTHIWVDRNPGGGSFGNGWLRIGEPGQDTSILYRIFLHEGTHAVNEYRGWPYEHKYCTIPGLDWRQEAGEWRHPRQQGRPPEPGEWETLPVDSRDVSTAPGEDLAEMVRYFVHSVKDERQFLWPLDQTKPALYLWDTSPTRFVFVRDHFLKLPSDHPWCRKLSAETEALAARNLSSTS